MKLYYTTASPYARKVRVLMHEKAVDDVELVSVNPFEMTDDLTGINPLSKVPALVLNDGSALFDSTVICEYLDASHAPAGRFFASGDPARWPLLRSYALAKGLMDICVGLALETRRRPQDLRSPQWIDQLCANMTRSINSLEVEIDNFGSDIDIAQIATGCALGYVDARALEYVTWRRDNPKLTAWFERFGQRPSMLATQPPV